MKKRIFALALCLVMAASALCGCNILDSDNPPTLPKFNMDSSELTGTVEYVNGRTIRITVTEGDSHYDGPYVNSKGNEVSGETVQVTYTDLKGAKSVGIGDTVTFTYNYITDVSERNGDPHITVKTLTVE